MPITMKATRAAIKTAKGLDELATEVAAMREQLNRIEDMLLAKVEAVEPAEPEPDAITKASAKVGIKTPPKSKSKGG